MSKAKNKFMTRFGKFITKQYGPRCDMRSPGCPCCEIWAAFDLVDTLLIEDIDYKHDKRNGI